MSDAKHLLESIEKDFKALKVENKRLKIKLTACDETAQHNAKCFGEASKALAGMTDLYNKAQDNADALNAENQRLREEVERLKDSNKGCEDCFAEVQAERNELKVALQLAKDMMIANELLLPNTFVVIDEAIASTNRGES